MKRMFLILSSWLAVSAQAAEPFDLSIDEFKMYQHYRNALEDERVKKMKPESRLKAIAVDAGFKVKELQRAVERGEAAGDLRGKCEAAIRAQLDKTELAQRVKRVEVDTDEPHAVAYVMWLNEEPSSLDVEACFAASAARAGCPIVSTVQIWSQAGEDPKTRVFEALISGSAAANIKPERIKDFAATRYIRLFEKVKSILRQDTFETPAPVEGSPQGT